MAENVNYFRSHCHLGKPILAVPGEDAGRLLRAFWFTETGSHLALSIPEPKMMTYVFLLGISLVWKITMLSAK